MSEIDKAIRTCLINSALLLLLLLAGFPIWFKAMGVGLTIIHVFWMVFTVELPKRKRKRIQDYPLCLFEDEPCDHSIYCQAIIVNDVLEGCEYPKRKRKRKNSEIIAVTGDDKPKAIIWFNEHQRKVALLREEWEETMRRESTLRKRKREDINSRYFDDVKNAQREYQRELEDVRMHHSVPSIGVRMVTK